MEENTVYNAFHDDEIETKDLNEGLKIKNKPRFKEPSREDFEKSVGSRIGDDNNIKAKFAELGLNYTKIIQNKTLSKNKNPLVIDNETNCIKDLVNFSQELNSNQSLPEGIGSIGNDAILFKVVLLQRDKINELGYKIEQLTNLVSDLLSEKK